MSKEPIIYLIRHGEKPPKESDGQDAPGLSAAGLERSQYLVNFFGANSEYNIGYILAEKPKKDGDRARPWLTVEPLAESLGKKVIVNKDIDRDDAHAVAKAAKGWDGHGNVLICWEHGQLSKIAEAIGIKKKIEYPGDRFDIIWTVDPPYKSVNSVTSEHCPGLDDAYADEG